MRVKSKAFVNQELFVTYKSIITCIWRGQLLINQQVGFEGKS